MKDKKNRIDTLFFGFWFNDVINYGTYQEFINSSDEQKINILNERLPRIINEWTKDQELKGTSRDKIIKTVESIRVLNNHLRNELNQ
jgi:hypothetical protein